MREIAIPSESVPSAANPAANDSVDLQRLCCLCSPSDQPAREYIRTCWELIKFYVVRGADVTHLSLYEGDSFVHAATLFSVMMGK